MIKVPRSLFFFTIPFYCLVQNQAIEKKEYIDPSEFTEHIYLHINKSRYERGDTIWFRLYDVTNGHRLSAISHVAYAELISPNDSVVQKLNLKLEAGMASGDIALPLSLPPGTYRISAYTNWMLRNNQEVYTREVVIGNPGKALPAGAAGIATDADIQFFPEGGDMVEGLRNVVAYKATKADGSPVLFTGTITGTDGQVLAELQGNNLGTGLFALTPQAGESYRANLTFTDGKTQTVALPRAKASGYALTLNNHDKDTLAIRVAANAEQLKTATRQDFYLVAQSQGKTYYTTSGKADAAGYRIRIAKNRFPTGITRFTLYAQSGEPLSERVVFIQSKDNLDLKAEPQNSNAFSITALTQADSTPATGSFSAAVFNEDKVPFDERTEPTIITSLLLNDELHGRVTHASYYLAHESEMDLLMLTQGYRKLEWKKADTSATAQESITRYQSEDGLAITGTLTDNKGKPVINGKVTLVSTNPMMKLDTTTNSRGRFAFTGLDIDDKIKLLLKATNGKSDAVKIVLDRPEAGKTDYQPLIPADTANNKQLLSAINKSYKDEEANYQKQSSKQLKEVTIKEKYDPVKKREEELAGSTNLNGPGHADQIIYGKDLENIGYLSEALTSKIPFSNSRKPGEFVIMNKGNSKVQILINGVPGAIDDTSPQDVYSVEVLTSPNYLALYGIAKGSLLLITTKKRIAKNETIPVEREPGVISFTYNGYYKAREFYQPKYEANITPQPSAIYWQPAILTDKEGKATVRFSNAGKGHYRVVVEGIDGEGRLGHAEYRYEVK